MGANAQHFAAKVSQRRRKLGLTFLDVKRNGGPTAPTLAKAEAGELDDPRPSTLSKFDIGLRWQPGSAASTYWDGDEPSPSDERRERAAILEPAAGSLELPLDRLLALMKSQAQLNDVLDGTDTVRTSELQPIVETLNSQISAVLGVYVTDLLERNHSQNSSVMQPLLEFAFAELLADPVTPTDPDREEKLYRRWLLGHTHAISSELQARFRRRLQRRSSLREGTQ